LSYPSIINAATYKQIVLSNGYNPMLMCCNDASQWTEYFSELCTYILWISKGKILIQL